MASTKDYSSKQESMIAEDLGWSVVSGSGAAPATPGDVIGDDWLGECKTHMDKTKIFFDYNVWVKIEAEASMRHRKPVLFCDDGSQTLASTWAVCYMHNIENPSSILATDVPFPVRKNLSFNSGDQLRYLTKMSKDNMGAFFRVISFEYQWKDYHVAIMPYYTFKEICAK